jgi:Domain of unknown function (DUF4157)
MAGQSDGGALRLQRKCGCGRSASDLTGECEQCGKAKLGVQRSLSVGRSNDPLELEADRVASEVTAAPRVDSPGRLPSRIQRISSGAFGEGTGSAVPASVESALAGEGRALDSRVRRDMEERFGQDFSRVRVHDDAIAAKSARDVRAHSYTVGRNIVFGAGRYAPTSRAGRHLLAHELAHVVQQRSGESASMLQRQDDDFGLGELLNLPEELAKEGEQRVREELRALGALPGTGALFSKAGCPSNFCNPFKDVSQAKTNLVLTTPFLLAGVAKAVNPRVVPLWKDYLLGGSAPQNLTSSFAADFTASQTTATTTQFIIEQMKKEIGASHAAIMRRAASVNVDLTPRMTRTLAAIDNPTGPNRMDFNKIGEIPGNIAGGIGKDELANKIGAQPSPFNDARTATIAAQLVRTPTSIRVVPAITFKVLDTIDLCPGDCGAVTERDATIPMSRFEATGLSGDVPFFVEFPAPAAARSGFDVPISTPHPAPGKNKPPAKPKGGHKTASLDLPSSSADAFAAATPAEDESGTGDELVMADEEVSPADEGEATV